MTNPYQKVYEFNKRFESKRYDNFTDDVFNDQELINLRLNLIHEEICELIEANKIDDRIGTIDALADIIYVVEGMAVSFGIEEIKMTSEPTLSEIDICESIDKAGFSDLEGKKCFCVNLIKFSQFLLHIAIEEKNKNFIVHFLRMIICLCFKLAIIIECNLSQAFDLVHESNMTKLCHSEQEAIDTIEHYKQQYTKGLSPYKLVTYKRSANGNYWIVYNSENRKILKSINYKPVDLSGL